MRLAIVGSQDLDNAQAANARWLVRIILEFYRENFPRYLNVVSGGARGVDTIVAEEAQELEIALFEYRPQVQQWEDRVHGDTVFHGFKHRNLRIIENCDRLIAIRAISSRTYGSGWTADEAERQGRLVRRYYV